MHIYMYISVVISNIYTHTHIHTCGDIDVYLLVVPQSDPCLVTALNSPGERIFLVGWWKWVKKFQLKAISNRKR